MRYLEASKVLRLIAPLFLIVVIGVYGQSDADDDGRMSTATFLQVAGINEAGPPRVLDDVVVFTYEQQRYARYVAAAFEHEGYRELHVFTAREREGRPDLFYLSYPVDVERSQLHYRLIVDGVWLTDPHAPKVRTDRNGVTVGTVTLNEPPPYERRSPLVHDDGTITFFFALSSRVSPTLETVDTRQLSVSSFGTPRVTIVGTFNGWDPYMHRLTGPDENGFYSIRLPLPEGPHYYYFLVDGHRVLDPLNGDRARDMQTGTYVSTFVVP